MSFSCFLFSIFFLFYHFGEKHFCIFSEWFRTSKSFKHFVLHKTVCMFFFKLKAELWYFFLFCFPTSFFLYNFMYPVALTTNAILDLSCFVKPTGRTHGSFFETFFQLSDTEDITEFKKLLTKVLKRKVRSRVPRIENLHDVFFRGVSPTPDPFFLLNSFAVGLKNFSSCDSNILFNHGRAAAFQIKLGSIFTNNVKKCLENILTSCVHEGQKHSWLTHESSQINYSHSGEVFDARPYPDGLFLLEKFLFQVCRIFIIMNLQNYRIFLRGYSPNCAAVHYSKDSFSGLGYHDDNDSFINHKLIFTFSVKSSCTFGIKKRKCGDSWTTEIEPFDLFVMLGDKFQQQYIHSVLQTEGRINGSFRHVKKSYCS
jgi:alkylated DNA repair dioxygenase AlkB